uniref:Uncharacterized protein n=1 Tax=Pristionchus pacificus TaxID=54126 RepID=A0A8R1Y760_PRIPA
MLLFPEMLSGFLFFSLFTLTSSKECQKRLPSVCTTCCALLYDNDDCETDNLFRVKWDADGFLGAIWEQQPRVVEVYPGCLLTLWEMRNQTGHNRALGLDGVNVHYLERYAFDRRASSLTCKCTSAAGKRPTTTIKPEHKEMEKANGNKHEEDFVPAVADSNDTTSVDVTVPKEGGKGDAESGYGSDPEGHLEEVKSLEDMGTGDDEKKEDKDEKEGLERKDSQEDQRDSHEKKDDTEDSSEERLADSSTTVVPSEQSVGADQGLDSPPLPSEISIPSLDGPIVDLTMTPPVSEIPLTIERIIAPKRNATS